MKEALMKVKSAFTWRLGIGIAGGAALGYAYYYFIGCASGSCPITSNPFASVAWGAAFGALLLHKENKNQ